MKLHRSTVLRPEARIRSNVSVASFLPIPCPPFVRHLGMRHHQIAVLIDLEIGRSDVLTLHWQFETKFGHVLDDAVLFRIRRRDAQMAGKFLHRRSPGAICSDGRDRRSVAQQMRARVAFDLRCQPAGHDNTAIVLAQLQRRQMIQCAAKPGRPIMTSTASSRPSGHRIPVGVISENIGWPLSTPRGSIASMAGVRGRAATDRAGRGARRCRTRASTCATAARPSSGPKVAPTYSG